MNRRNLLTHLGSLALICAWPAQASSGAPEIQVFKSRSCACCSAWVGHLRAAGFDVAVVEVHSAARERRRLGMPVQYGSCHTSTVAGYVLEGHVPVADIARLLATRPRALGLAVPGMPASSPGMEVPGRRDPYNVLLIDTSGQASVFARYNE